VAQPTQLAHIVSDPAFSGKTGTRYAPRVIQIILTNETAFLHSEETSDRIRGMEPRPAMSFRRHGVSENRTVSRLSAVPRLNQ